MDYLTALAANNDREWYHAHKADYKAANALNSLCKNLFTE